MRRSQILVFVKVYKFERIFLPAGHALKLY
jgi:hypothetical protein